MQSEVLVIETVLTDCVFTISQYYIHI